MTPALGPTRTHCALPPFASGRPTARRSSLRRVSSVGDAAGPRLSSAFVFLRLMRELRDAGLLLAYHTVRMAGSQSPLEMAFAGRPRSTSTWAPSPDRCHRSSPRSSAPCPMFAPSISPLPRGLYGIAVRSVIRIGSAEAEGDPHRAGGRELVDADRVALRAPVPNLGGCRSFATSPHCALGARRALR